MNIKYLDIDNTWNAYIEIDNKFYRYRCEGLIIKDNMIYIRIKDDNKYKFPGGSLEPQLTEDMCVVKECKEESRLIVKPLPEYKIKYTKDNKDLNKKYPKHGIDYTGYFNVSMICEYVDEYKGNVDEIDRDDDFMSNGKFYLIEEVYDRLEDRHKELLYHYLIENRYDIYLKLKALNVIEESLIIESDILYSDKDIEYKLDDFYNDKSNILFITGYSGSGKTTLAENIQNELKSKDTDCYIISLDDLFNVIKEKYYHDNISCELVKEYIDKNNINKYNFGDISRDKLHLDYIKFVIDKIYTKDKTNAKYIIEGIQLIYIYDKLEKKYPLVIKNTSVSKSIVNAIKREGDLLNYISKYKRNLKDWYIGDDTIIDRKKRMISLYNTLKEEALSSKERSILSDKDFGIPELRKFPIHDESHVRSAMSYFHTCPDKYKYILAKNILRQAKKFNIDINKEATWYKYIKEDKDLIDYLSIHNRYDAFIDYIESDDDELDLDIPVVINELSIDKYDKDDYGMLYVVLTSTTSNMAKMIKKVTKTPYNHASLSFDLDLKRMYSFGRGDTKKYGGFDIESYDNTYIRNFGKVPCVIYGVVVPKNDIENLKHKLNEYLVNYKNLKYSTIGLIGYLINRPIKPSNAMFCSQFVDTMLKFANTDLTHKDSGLIQPYDFAMVKDKRVFKLYEGGMEVYNKSKIEPLVDKYIKYYKSNILKESSISEAKKFPIQFDKEGNLIISNILKTDYEEEYQKSHKLLISYSENNNYDGIMYELSKLWYINTSLEKKINDKKIDKNERKKLLKLRARILNDFYKYIKIISEKGYNFTEYYEKSPFSDSEIIFGKDSLKGLITLAKYAMI